MKKFIKNLTIKILVLIAFTVSSSCSKSGDDQPQPAAPILAPLQDPLLGFLEATGYNQVNVAQQSDNEENIQQGYAFIPLVDGKMTAIVLKLPAARQGVIVKIWDRNTGNLIKTETINVPTANVEVIKQINTIDLLKDKQYVINMFSNIWYSHGRTDIEYGTFPVIVKDIKITDCLSSFSQTNETIPTATFLNIYKGDCSFKFQK